MNGTTNVRGSDSETDGKEQRAMTIPRSAQERVQAIRELAFRSGKNAVVPSVPDEDWRKAAP